MSTNHDTQDIAVAVRDWLADVNPEVIGKYEFAPPGKDQGLPDVAVEVRHESVQLDSDPRLPQVPDVQQAVLRVYEVEASFMVDQGVVTQDAADAGAMLRRFVDQTVIALHGDTTLGGRVQYASPLVEADFEPKFVRYEDGTRGRMVRVDLVIGELLGG